MDFIGEIDHLKTVLRQSLIAEGSRRENSAEHSWHLAMMILVLKDFAAEPFDLLTAVKMALIHDIVEIDAGDVCIYDEKGRTEKAALEQKAAQRLFGLLPSELGEELHQLWLEYEACESPEARFTKAVDRLQPLLNNAATGGHSWKKHQVRRHQVEALVEEWRAQAPALADYAFDLVEQCVQRGDLST